MENNNLLNILKQYWGYDSFREPQLEIINHVMNHHDTIALLHTGAGKSLCYQLPALAMPGKTIVVSPLIALMQDQVAGLKARGINAQALISSMRYRDIDIALDNFVYGNTKLLYVSPERIKSDIFIERFKKAEVSLIAVDESHCISQWGQDFRPAYYEISNLRELKPKVPIIAVTATATSRVVEDIVDKLELRKPKIFKSSFARDNLSLSVVVDKGKDHYLYKILKKFRGSGIIYVRSRRDVAQTADALNKAGYKAAFYHGGLSIERRMQVQQDWIANKIQIIVATNAFGMGVDKADVRFVVHLDVPPSVEEYYQEVGRGGRDGKLSYGVLVVSQVDMFNVEKKHTQQFPSLEYVKRVYTSLCRYLKVAYGAGEEETYEIDLEHFSTIRGLNSSKVLNALKILEKEGWLTLGSAFRRPSKLLVTASKDRVLQADRKSLRNKVIHFMVRNYTGLFIDYGTIDEGKIANEIGCGRKKVEAVLRELARDGLVQYQPASELPQITFLLNRPEDHSFYFEPSRYLERELNAKKRLTAILEYASNFECRQVQILRYFSEESEPCGLCDVCRGSLDTEFTPEEKLKLDKHLADSLRKRPLTLNQYLLLFPFNKRAKARRVVLALVAEQKYRIDLGKLIKTR